MKKFIPFLFLIASGCTVDVTDYTSAEEDSGSPWVDIYGDTTKDMSIYVTYAGGKVVASISGYTHPDSIGFIEDINVSISEFSEQDVPLLVCYGAFPGTTNYYLEAYSFGDIRDTLIADCDSLTGEKIDFQVTRTYSVGEEQLPENVTLTFDVKTIYGNKSGSHRFKKIVREVEQAIRIH